MHKSSTKTRPRTDTANAGSGARVIFFGTAEFAGPVLEALVKADFDVVAVVTAPDKPAGRKQILTPPPIKLAAERLNLKILQFPSLKIENLKFKIPDANVGVVAAYGKIIPSEIFNLPEHGMLVVHPSLLPKYRGPTPIQSAILNGDKGSGVTIMKMDEEIDHGNIISRTNYQMPDNASFTQINADIWQLGAELLIKTLPDYLSGNIKPQPQDHSQATFTHKFSAEDGEIKSSDTPETAYNKIRALNPEPGTFIWFEKNGSPRSSGADKKTRLKILDAELKNGHLELKIVQLEGGKPMNIKEFLIGHPNFKLNLL